MQTGRPGPLAEAWLLADHVDGSPARTVDIVKDLNHHASVRRSCRNRRATISLRLRKILSVLSFICAVVPSVGFASHASSTAEGESAASLLTRLAPFIDWPADAFASPESPLVICVSAAEPATADFRRNGIDQKDGRRPIRWRLVRSPEGLGDCHILYLGESGDLLVRSAEMLRHRPVLTVSHSGIGAYDAAMIIFVVDHGRIRFDIDDATALSSRLTISSKLLALARKVKPPLAPR